MATDNENDRPAPARPLEYARPAVAPGRGGLALTLTGLPLALIATAVTSEVWWRIGDAVTLALLGTAAVLYLPGLFATVYQSTRKHPSGPMLGFAWVAVVLQTVFWAVELCVMLV